MCNKRCSILLGYGFNLFIDLFLIKSCICKSHVVPHYMNKISNHMNKTIHFLLINTHLVYKVTFFNLQIAIFFLSAVILLQYCLLRLGILELFEMCWLTVPNLWQSLCGTEFYSSLPYLNGCYSLGPHCSIIRVWQRKLSNRTWNLLIEERKHHKASA